MSCRTFLQRTQLNHPIGTKPHVFVRFVVFGCVLDHFCTKLGAIWAEQVQLVKKVRSHEVVSEFFTLNATIPPHWNINSGFGLFRCVWLHLGSFHYRTKLGANWVEVVPLLKKRSCHEVVSEFFQRTHPVHLSGS